MTLVATCTVRSPLGPLRLHATASALVALDLPNAHATLPGDATAPGDAPALAPAHAILDAAARELDAYFAGALRAFATPLAPSGTPFQLGVWRALAAIPFGETRSYAELARAIGRPSAVRAVGAANGRNPLAILVPCHRVLGADGSLTGFGGGLPAKRWLLSHESRHAHPTLSP